VRVCLGKASRWRPEQKRGVWVREPQQSDRQATGGGPSNPSQLHLDVQRLSEDPQPHLPSPRPCP
jgi:hypothetical protein